MATSKRPLLPKAVGSMHVRIASDFRMIHTRGITCPQSMTRYAASLDWSKHKGVHGEGESSKAPRMAATSAIGGVKQKRVKHENTGAMRTLVKRKKTETGRVQQLAPSLHAKGRLGGAPLSLRLEMQPVEAVEFWGLTAGRGGILGWCALFLVTAEIGHGLEGLGSLGTGETASGILFRPALPGRAICSVSDCASAYMGSLSCKE